MGATVSEKLHWLRLAGGTFAQRWSTYILITTDVLHPPADDQQHGRRVEGGCGVGAGVELSGELSTASVLEALGELDGGGPTGVSRQA